MNRKNTLWQRCRAAVLTACSCVVLTVVCLLFAACGNEDTVNVSDLNKQTVLVFMPWTGDASGASGLYTNFQQNLDSIGRAIVANRGYSGRLMVFLSTGPSESSLFEMTYKSGAVSRTPVKTYSGTAYTTAAGIAQIICDVKEHASALNYAMVIGGHGCGWTRAADWQQPAARRQARHSAAAQQGDHPLTRYFGAGSPNTYAIDVETLAEGIGQAGVKLQYVLFDCCLMANVETAHALRQTTNWLVASTSEIMALGMPYASMWSSMGASAPSYRNMVSTFHTFYSSYSTPCGALSAIDCRQMDALAAIMKEINSRYAWSPALTDSLQVLDGYSTPLFFDLASYVDHLCPNATLLSDFHAQLKRTVPYTSTTPTLYSYLYSTPVYIPVATYSGITVSDPSLNPVAVSSRQTTSWWKATHGE